MTKMRLSVPFVGGIMVEYSEEEVKQMKQSLSNGVKKVSGFFRTAGLVGYVLAKPAIDASVNFSKKTMAKVHEHQAKKEEQKA